MNKKIIIVSFVSFLFVSALFSQAPEIYVYEAPELVTDAEEKKHSAYAMADVECDYEKLHDAYCDNTKKLEPDDHYDRKETIKEKENFRQYQIIFSHWLAGEVFRLQEDHTKLENAEWWVSAESLVFKGIKKANMWTIKKYLMPETKSNLVGDDVKYIKIYIAFIEMDKKKTRVFFHILVDAKERRNMSEIKSALAQSMSDILEVAGIETQKR